MGDLEASVWYRDGKNVVKYDDYSIFFIDSQIKPIQVRLVVKSFFKLKNKLDCNYE